MHREYLRENKPMLFNDLVLSCQLWTYLADINEQPRDRLQVIISQMQKAESVTEKMKEGNLWEWIKRMGSIHNRAEEIVGPCILFSKRNHYSHSKSCIMIITEPTTPLIFHAQPGGTFSFMGCFMYQYPKQILTIAQQVQSYIDAGMVITSRADVEKSLKSVGFF